MTDDDIIRMHDQMAVHTQVGIVQYRTELERRDAQRQGDRIEAMTRTMKRLTWTITALTVAITIATFIILYLAIVK